LSPTAVELFDGLAILLVVHRIVGLGSADSRPLHSDNNIRMKEFTGLAKYVPFRPLLGVVCASGGHATPFHRGSSWDHIFVILCMRVVLALLHGFLFPGVKPLGCFSIVICLVPTAAPLIIDSTIKHLKTMAPQFLRTLKRYLSRLYFIVLLVYLI
jgi:hypothetical protein